MSRICSLSRLVIATRKKCPWGLYRELPGKKDDRTEILFYQIAWLDFSPHACEHMYSRWNRFFVHYTPVLSWWVAIEKANKFKIFNIYWTQTTTKSWFLFAFFHIIAQIWTERALHSAGIFCMLLWVARDESWIHFTFIVVKQTTAPTVGCLLFVL